MKYGAIYARVSTRRQEKEATIESQIARLLAYAQEQEIEVPERYRFIDQAVSGAQLARPGLDRLRDEVQLGGIAVVLCLSPDRLARQLGAQQVVIDELKRHGVKLQFINQPELGDAPQAKLLLDIQGAFAEYERVVISERMRRGKMYRLKQGETAPSSAPYGYRYHKEGRRSHWEIFEPEAAIVKRIFRWYTEQSVTISKIAAQLNQEKVSSPGGKKWHPGAVGRLLRYSAYRGQAWYNRHRGDYSSIGQPRQCKRGRLQYPRQVLRPSEEWISISVPPIISEQRWQMAQNRLKMNARYAQRNTRRPYLLRGLLVCGVCGRTLQGRTQSGRFTYFCVYGGVKRPPDVPHHHCILAGEQVETLLWQELTALLQSPLQLEEAWQKALNRQQATPSELSHWQQRLAVLQKQRQRLLDAYQVDALSLDDLIARQNLINLELEELQQKLKAADPAETRVLDLQTFTRHIQRALDSADFQLKQEVIHLLIERIVVTDEALTVEYVIPTVNFSRLRLTCRSAWQNSTRHALRTTRLESKNFLT